MSTHNPDIFKIAKQTLEDKKRFEAYEKAQSERTIDWKDRREVSAYQLGRYHERRDAGLPANRKCPLCGSVKANRRSWVFTPVSLLVEKRELNPHAVDILLEASHSASMVMRIKTMQGRSRESRCVACCRSCNAKHLGKMKGLIDRTRGYRGY